MKIIVCYTLHSNKMVNSEKLSEETVAGCRPKCQSNKKEEERVSHKDIEAFLKFMHIVEVSNCW